MGAEVLDGIHGTCLDCLQVNLAVLADRHHGPGTHLRLGASLCFRPVFGTGLPTIEASLAARIDQARTMLGLAAAQWHDRLRPDELASLLGNGHTYYVVADAYRLPWVPYCGQRHMEHSFLATRGTEGVLITDAYHNDTPWGQARPGTWRLMPEELVDALAGSLATAIRLIPIPLTAPHAYRPGIEAPDADVVRRYAEIYRTWPDRHAALDRLALETWLLARERLLFATRAGDPRPTEHAAAFRRLAEKTYLVLRRVELGRPEPASLLDDMAALLLAEADLAAVVDGDTADRVGRVVLDAVTHVLDVARDQVAVAASLREFPQFNSFHLVQVLERVERALDIEVPPEELVPENLCDVASLRQLFVRCLTRTTANA